MAFHIPFNQRASAQQRPAPIYIGFEVPRPPRKKFNWWGFNGMWMSFASLLTAGFASPVPLLISLVGLRRPGKKMASVGAFVSSLGVAMATTIVVFAASHAEIQQAARHNRIVKKQIAETDALMAIAGIEIQEFREDVVDESRFDIEANMLILHHVDPWGQSLRFDLNDKDGLVRSAGPDKKFDTGDDVTLDLGESGNAATSVESDSPVEDEFATGEF